MEERVERRIHKRFQVPIGVFVAFGPDHSSLGEIIDISMGGLSFRYLATEDPLIRSSTLDIFLTDRDFCLNDVPFETVSDFGTHQIPFVPVTMRRRGVQFGEMKNNQASGIEYFIQHFTVRDI
jgi:hypothetical protein